AEGLADRGLLRLEALRLLERDRGLGRHALLQAAATFLEVLVGVRHRRYGTFSRIRSTGDVMSRVRPTWIADTAAPASIASWKTWASSYGGPPGSGSRNAATRGPTAKTGAAVQSPSASGSFMRTIRPSLTPTRV